MLPTDLRMGFFLPLGVELPVVSASRGECLKDDLGDKVPLLLGLKILVGFDPEGGPTRPLALSMRVAGPKSIDLARLTTGMAD